VWTTPGAAERVDDVAQVAEPGRGAGAQERQRRSLLRTIRARCRPRVVGSSAGVNHPPGAGVDDQSAEHGVGVEHDLLDRLPGQGSGPLVQDPHRQEPDHRTGVGFRPLVVPGRAGTGAIR
jgi:hypothetical protein